MADIKGAAPPYTAHNPSYQQHQVAMDQQQVNHAPPYAGQDGMVTDNEKAVPMQQVPQQQVMQPQQFQSAVPLANLNATAAPVDCPLCRVRAMTRTTSETGNTNLAWAIGTCLVCCCLAFIPFVMDSLKNVRHHCGNCGAALALWHKSGRTDVLAHA